MYVLCYTRERPESSGPSESLGGLTRLIGVQIQIQYREKKPFAERLAVLRIVFFALRENVKNGQ